MLQNPRLWKGYASKFMTQRLQNHANIVRFGKDMLQNEDILCTKSQEPLNVPMQYLEFFFETRNDRQVGLQQVHSTNPISLYLQDFLWL